MYLRTTKVKRPDGTVDEYIRLVESYWNDGSPRHRVICNLGRKDLLAPHAEALLQLLKGEEKNKVHNQGAAAQQAAARAREGPPVAAVVWDAGPVGGASRADGEGIVSALAESVFVKRRSGFLRFDVHVFRGQRSCRICSARA